MSTFKKIIKETKFQPDVLYVQVSKILTEAILEGQFEAGQKLVETQIQKMLGISRSPLREAIRDLEKKGLVAIVPRRGAFVKGVTTKDIEDIFPVRADLEALASELAYNNISRKELDQMKNILVKMKEAVDSNDIKTYWRHHSAFHEIFIGASDNDVLIDFLSRLRLHTMWHRLSYQYYKENLKAQFEIHQQIYDLFESPDTNIEELRGLVSDHIKVAYGKFVGYLSRKGKAGKVY